MLREAAFGDNKDSCITSEIGAKNSKRIAAANWPSVQFAVFQFAVQRRGTKARPIFGVAAAPK